MNKDHRGWGRVFQAVALLFSTLWNCGTIASAQTAPTGADYERAMREISARLAVIAPGNLSSNPWTFAGYTGDIYYPVQAILPSNAPPTLTSQQVTALLSLFTSKLNTILNNQNFKFVKDIDIATNSITYYDRFDAGYQSSGWPTGRSGLDSVVSAFCDLAPQLKSLTRTDIQYGTTIAKSLNVDAPSIVYCPSTLSSCYDCSSSTIIPYMGHTIDDALSQSLVGAQPINVAVMSGAPQASASEAVDKYGVAYCSCGYAKASARASSTMLLLNQLSDLQACNLDVYAAITQTPAQYVDEDQNAHSAFLTPVGFESFPAIAGTRVQKWKTLGRVTPNTQIKMTVGPTSPSVSVLTSGIAKYFRDDHTAALWNVNITTVGTFEFPFVRPAPLLDQNGRNLYTPQPLGVIADAGLTPTWSCLDNTTVGIPLSRDPVSLSTGTKVETATDLTIPNVGQSFVLQRQYTSDINYLQPGDNSGSVIGSGWVVNINSFLRLNNITGSENLPDSIDCDGWPVDRHSRFTKVPGENRWVPGGASSQYITRVGNSISTYVYTLHEPGGWTRNYGHSGFDDSIPIYTILSQVDTYQNIWTFTSFKGRVQEILINGIPATSTAATPPDSTISFSWSAAGGDQNIDKLITGISVKRFDKQLRIEKQTQAVKYTYARDGLVSPDVGTGHDLIQVEKSVLVDVSNNAVADTFYHQITQYRYHVGGVLHQTSSDPRIHNLGGHSSQLKMVIMPEQIEYCTRIRYAEDPNPPSDAVSQTAAYLLTLADDAIIQDSNNNPTGLKLVDLANKVINYENPTTTSGTHRVLEEYVQAGCGCGAAGAAGQSRKETYQYTAWQDGVRTGTSVRMTETLMEEGGTQFNVPYRSNFTDMEYRSGVAYTIYDAVRDDSPGGAGRVLVTGYSYDDHNQMTATETPENFTSYLPVDANNVAPSAPRTSAGGRVDRYVYNNDRRMTEHRIASGYADSGSLVERISYPPVGSSGNRRSWLPEKIERFRESGGSSAASDVEVTTYAYRFYSTNAGAVTDALSAIETTVERELQSENGPDGDGNLASSLKLFDDRGLLRWQRLPDGSFDYMDYDQQTGALIQSVQNAPVDGKGSSSVPEFIPDLYAGANDFRNDVPTGFAGRAVDGGWLESRWTVDLLGRVIKSESPGGAAGGRVASYVRREVRPIDAGHGVTHPGIGYLAELKLPQKLAEGGPTEFDGPATISWVDAAGKSLGSSSYSMTTGSTQSAYDPIASGFSFDEFKLSELSRSRVCYSVAGLPTVRIDWLDLAGIRMPNTRCTHFAYDNAGRLSQTTSPNGTISATVYDAFDRPIQQSIGVSSTSLTKTTEFYYDTNGGDWTSRTQVGNGLLTLTREFTGETGPGAIRETRRIYDQRDRLVEEVAAGNDGTNPSVIIPPVVTMAYDNLDRVIERAVYSSDDLALAHRGSLTRTRFSQRGLAYRTLSAIDPTQGESGLQFTESDAWFDEVGRSLAELSVNDGMTKRRLDGLGRVVEEAHTDGYNDPLPGVSGSFAAATWHTNDDDHFIRVTSRRYAAANDATLSWTGNVLLESTLLRPHDLVAGGELTSSNAVATYAGYHYDSVGRLIRTVDFGTNLPAGSTFDIGGVAPAVPLPTVPEPDRSDTTRHVTSVTYGVRGLPEIAGDPMGRLRKTFYDDLNRPIVVMENYSSTPSPSVTWNASNEDWDVTGQSASDHTLNRATGTVYDGEDHVIKAIAYRIDSGGALAKDVTTYFYEQTGSAASPPSFLESKSLLSRIAYPKVGDGDQVTFGYNALGEVRATIDQNRTLHEYTRDGRGRTVTDHATIDPRITDGSLEDAVSAITTGFDDLGRVSDVQSLSPSSAVVNAVRFTYNPQWHMSAIYQNNSGAVTLSNGAPTGTTQRLLYNYSVSELSAPRAGNHDRLSYLLYPEGAQPVYMYGESGSTDDLISRANGLMEVTTSQLDLARYHWLGERTVAVIDGISSDIQLDMTVDKPGASRGSRAPFVPGTQPYGAYPGYDRFGRVARMAWIDGSYTTTTNPSHASRIPIVYQEYTYDNADNRLTRLDRRDGAITPNRDQEFSYDNLDRLTEARRGVRTSPANWSFGKGSQRWSLDELGNWAGSDVDLAPSSSGYGGYNDAAGDLGEARQFLRNNNIAGRTINGTSLSGTVSLLNGNTRQSPRVSSNGTENGSDVYAYDAWNRLVRHTVLVNGNSTIRAQFQYNGLNWRTTEIDGSSVPNHTTQFYYDADWRPIEEHVHVDAVGSTPAHNYVVQEFYGLRGLDDALYRRVRVPTPPEGNGDAPNSWTFNNFADTEFYHLTDDQFTTLAMVRGNWNADLFERVEYNAYGKGTQRYAADVTGDGIVNGADLAAIHALAVNNTPVGDPSYNADYDLDRDGIISSKDEYYIMAQYGRAAVGDAISDHSVSDPSQVDPPPSGPNNILGFAGMVQGRPSTGLLLARNRWLDPQVGRWLTRDPAGYVDGQNLFEYCSSNGINRIDVSGLGETDLKYEAKMYMEEHPELRDKHGSPIDWDYYRNDGSAFGAAVSAAVDIARAGNSVVSEAYHLGNDIGTSFYDPAGRPRSALMQRLETGTFLENSTEQIKGLATLPYTVSRDFLVAARNSLDTGEPMGSATVNFIILEDSLRSFAARPCKIIENNPAIGGTDATSTMTGPGIDSLLGPFRTTITGPGLSDGVQVTSTVTRFGNALSSAYRETFFAANPELRGQVVVHHAVEQQVLNRFPGVVTEAEIHSLENLRGIPKAVNSEVHLRQIRSEWDRFYRSFEATGSSPTKAQLLQKAADIDAKFGQQFKPPVRGGQ